MGAASFLQVEQPRRAFLSCIRKQIAAAAFNGGGNDWQWQGLRAVPTAFKSWFLSSLTPAKI
jgi:hypothetical protein